MPIHHLFWHKLWRHQTVYDIIWLHQRFGINYDVIVPLMTSCDYNRGLTWNMTSSDGLWRHLVAAMFWHKLWRHRSINDLMWLQQKFTWIMTSSDGSWHNLVAATFWRKLWRHRTVNDFMLLQQRFDVNYDVMGRFMTYNFVATTILPKLWRHCTVNDFILLQYRFAVNYDVIGRFMTYFCCSNDFT